MFSAFQASPLISANKVEELSIAITSSSWQARFGCVRSQGMPLCSVQPNGNFTLHSTSPLKLALYWRNQNTSFELLELSCLMLVCLCVHVCMYVHTYIDMYVHMYVCLYSYCYMCMSSYYYMCTCVGTCVRGCI